MTVSRIKKPAPEREHPDPDDGRDSEYDNRRKQEEDKIRSLGNLTVEDLDKEAEGLDLEDMYGRDILQRAMDDLANRHTEQMRNKDKKG